MRNRTLFAVLLMTIAGATAPATGQSVKHIQSEGSGIALGVWVGDMFYLSGQLPTPVTPADREKGTPAVYGTMQQQAESVFTKIENALKAQGLGMGDVVMMRVYLAADKDGKLDFAGMNASYAKFFGTAAQPNKPARAALQVAALVAQGALLEVEVQAARSRDVAPQSGENRIFTPQQANDGKTAFAKSCATCHMPDLSGNNEAPPLTGTLFTSTWRDRTTKELLEYMSAEMPRGGDPLMPETYLSLTAFILQANGVMAGDRPFGASTAVPIGRLVR